MIGVINALLFNFIEARWGKEMLAQVRLQNEMEANFTFRIHRVYSDTEWGVLYDRVIALVNAEREAFEWDFGIYSGEQLFTRHADLIRNCKSARDVLTLQPHIHHQIADAVADPEQHRKIMYKFYLEDRDGMLVMHYRSPNKMCTFYRALAHYAGYRYGETVQIDEMKCMKQGDAECELHLHLAS